MAHAQFGALVDDDGRRECSGENPVGDSIVVRRGAAESDKEGFVHLLHAFIKVFYFLQVTFPTPGLPLAVLSFQFIPFRFTSSI